MVTIGGIEIETPLALGPMAGVTDMAFRTICREQGAGLTCTEMVSANALKYKDRATKKLLFTTKEEKIRAVQLLGGIPAVMEQMAVGELLRDFDIIDINMGCPVPNVFKSGEGSALMLDPKRASAIIRGCKKSGKPVSVKFRTGIREDAMFTAEFARMCEASGADLISIHGRSRSMMYDGEPYYEEIEQAKAAVSIPVIANGGICSVEDAERMMDRTGADGVMPARYALEHPWIFSELTGRPCEKTAFQIVTEQLALTSRYYDETFTLTYMRKLASYMMKKRKGTKRYKEYLYKSGSLEELQEVLERIFLS